MSTPEPVPMCQPVESHALCDTLVAIWGAATVIAYYAKQIQKSA